MKNKKPPAPVSDTLQLYFEAFETQLKALKLSARWRIGHLIISAIEKLLLRKPTLLAIDQMENMLLRLKDRRFSSEINKRSTDDDLPIFTGLVNNSHKLKTCDLLVSDTNWKQASQGDVFTALELAEAVNQGNSFHFELVDFQTVQNSRSDIIISLLYNADVSTTRPGVLKIAWVRSYAEHWLMKPWFHEFDIVLCSSHKILDFFEQVTDKPCFLFPIATNPDRFHHQSKPNIEQFDYCFTGHYWKQPRRVIDWLKPSELNYVFKVFGNGWQNHDKIKPYFFGGISYQEMSDVYAACRLVLDDANESTTKWESVNSRVFDALAADKMVLTNNEKGVQHLFEHTFPTYSSADELNAKVDALLSDTDDRQAVFSKLKKEVLDFHTYQERARKLEGIIEFQRGKKYSIAIRIAANDLPTIESWGDYQLAKSMKNAFEKWGHNCDVLLYRDANREDYDVYIDLNGVRQFPIHKNAHHILWIISHPENIIIEKLAHYNFIFCASSKFTNKLKKLKIEHIDTLLQCTDPEVFYNEKSKNFDAHDRLYIANSRNKNRLAVMHALSADLPLSIFGSGWKDLVPADWLQEEFVPYDLIRYYYSSATYVLNDHWDDMRTHGFVSNRLLDVLSCGGHVVTDFAGEFEEEFGEYISVYTNETEFKSILTAGEGVSRPTVQIINKIKRHHSVERRIVSILNKINELQR